MKYITPLLLFIFLLTGCKGVKVRSDNEPKNDLESLKIVGIKMTPEPKVLYRKYEAGLDDNMRLVVEFNSDRLSEFWRDSLWSSEKSKIGSGDGSAGAVPFPWNDGDKDWIRWKISSKGLTASSDLPDGEYASVYLAQDIEADKIVAFIFWHQT